MLRNIAYLRVSAFEQDSYKNKTDIRSLSNEKKICKTKFEENIISSKVSWNE